MVNTPILTISLITHPSTAFFQVSDVLVRFSHFVSYFFAFPSFLTLPQAGTGFVVDTIYHIDIPYTSSYFFSCFQANDMSVLYRWDTLYAM